MSRLPTIAQPKRKPYPSDISDEEWEILKALLPKPKGLGHPVEVDFREILNGIFYVQGSGCQWEMFPMTCRQTPQCITITIFRNGSAKGYGSRCMTSGGFNYAKIKDVINTQQWRSLIQNR